MAKAKQTKKFAAVKRMLSPKDARLPGVAAEAAKKAAAAAAASGVRNVPQVPSSLFFKYNTALGPPYHLLIDTNFVNFAVKNKLEIVRAAMDCLLAKVVPCVTDCVMAELEKLGPKFRVALRVAKDPRFERIPCEHRGTYADDCIVHRVTEVRDRCRCGRCECAARGAANSRTRRAGSGAIRGGSARTSRSRCASVSGIARPSRLASAL